MTVQVENTLRSLETHHGYAAEFVQSMGYGISLYSVGGIIYSIRGDGTVL